MSEMEQDAPARTHRSDPYRLKSGMGWVVLLVIPLLYVLSIGPAAWLYDHIASPDMQEALEACYAPLILLIEHEVPGIGPALEWYIDLFAA